MVVESWAGVASAVPLARKVLLPHAPAQESSKQHTPHVRDIGRLMFRPRARRELGGAHVVRRHVART